MATKPDRVVTPLGSPTDKVMRTVDHVQDHLINYNNYISTTAVAMATKLDKMVTYLNGLLAIKLPDPLFTRSSEVT